MTARFHLAAAGPLLCSTLLLSGCGSSAPKASTPPAKVANPVKEADLTTVTLTPEAEKRLGIETAVLELRDLGARRQTAGDVVAPPGRIVPLTAATAGRVEWPAQGAAAAGPRVRRVRARAPPDAARHAARATLRVTYEADAKAAARAARRRETAARPGAAAPARPRRQSARRRARRAGVRAGQGGISTPRNERLARLADRPLDGDVAMPVTAPFDGILSQVHVGGGQVVPAGAALIEVADLRTMWVRVPVYAGELSALGEIRRSRSTTSRPSPAAAGVVARRVTGPPAADPQAASADLYFEFDNRASAFRPGQKVGVSLPSGAAGPLAHRAGFGGRVRLPGRRLDLREHGAARVRQAPGRRHSHGRRATSCSAAGRPPAPGS